MHYDPYATILTSVEFDHADIFKDEDHVLQVFKNFASGLNSTSTLFAFIGDGNVEKVVNAAGCRVVGYGKSKGLGWWLGEVDLTPPGLISRYGRMVPVTAGSKPCWWVSTIC
jgi:UDP-N-acetylmuramate: L-alanyl-gamma-D-glutamyl-meso-diaminopimelate ligase